MTKLLLTSIVSGTLTFAILPASAMPVAQPIPNADASQPSVILASGGCGFYRHRGPFGGCRPNFVGGGPYGFYRPGFYRPGFYGGFHRYGWRRRFF